MHKKNLIGFKILNKICYFEGINLSKTTLGFTIGIVGFFVLLTILLSCVLVAYSNRKRSRNASVHKSDLNLYYTCEKQMADDECSIFKFSKCLKQNESSIDSASSSDTTSKQLYKKDDACARVVPHTPRLFENNLFDRNDANTHIYHETNSAECQLLLRNFQHYMQQIKPNSPSYLVSMDASNRIIRNSPFKSSRNTSTTSSSSSSSHKQAASFTTKTSTISSASPASSAYYETPKLNHTYQQPNHATTVKCGVNSNYVMPNYANVSHTDAVKELITEQIYEVPDKLLVRNDLKMNTAKLLSTLSDIKNYNLEFSDVCAGKINSSGAKLSLDCGIVASQSIINS